MRFFLSVTLTVSMMSGLLSLVLLVCFTDNASRLTNYYDTLLVLNSIFSVTLSAWVVILFISLVRKVYQKLFGACLTVRLVLAFTFVGTLPGISIYILSLQLMSRSIESWFDVRVDKALEAGLALTHVVLDAELIDLQERARSMAVELNHKKESKLAFLLTQLRENNGVQEAMIFAGNGRPIAFSTNQCRLFLPIMPTAILLNQLRLAHGYAATEAEEVMMPGTRAKLHFRVVVPMTAPGYSDIHFGSMQEPRWLQLIQTVPSQIAENANWVQQGFHDHQQLALSRIGLHNLHEVVLTLTLLLAILSATTLALSLSERLIRPLLQLVSGTKAVSIGDYSLLPELRASNEISQLTYHFNTMIKQLDEARCMVESNKKKLEMTNTYLESVMDNLSSGVIVFDEAFRISTINPGAQSILQHEHCNTVDNFLEKTHAGRVFMQMVKKAFHNHFSTRPGRQCWQQQCEIALEKDTSKFSFPQKIILLVRGTHLRTEAQGNGHMVVFDDVTEVILANQTVAWCEAARRLAHEIKNPLTPIQLSAERLATQLSGKLPVAETKMLGRAMHTIVNQVTSLKHMVNEFQEYARVPPLMMQNIDLNALVADILALYGWDPNNGILKRSDRLLNLDVRLSKDLPAVQGDPTQLRQVIHNIISNSCDAIEEKFSKGSIKVLTRFIKNYKKGVTEQPAVNLTVLDSGPGFPAQVIQHAFEPYITTKSHGTGLGLAIVRKIIREHGGRIEIANREEGGAQVSISLVRLVLHPIEFPRE